MSSLHEEYDDSKQRPTSAVLAAPADELYTAAELDPVYAAKARLLNAALQDIGMGRYQWILFVVTGFGWLADNLWPVVTGLILSPVINEFAFQGPFLKLGQNIGLLVGAVFWGVGSDVWGRRPSFNITLGMTGVFAVAAGASPGYVALCALAGAWSVGVGGNLPVDSAVFLEFVPASHQYLLTVLSVWWALGQLIGSLVRPPAPLPPDVCDAYALPPDRLAPPRELLVPHHRPAHALRAVREPGVALLPLHDGRAHAPPLGAALLRLQAVREPEVPHGPRARRGGRRRRARRRAV